MYTDAVTALNDEAANGETYAALPGAPTLTIGGTTWYLVERSDSSETADRWFRVLPEARNGFSTVGGYDDVVDVLANS